MSIHLTRSIVRKRAFSRMSESYIGTSWVKRIVGFISILSVLALVLIQTVPEGAFSILLSMTIFLVVLHFTLRYPNIVKIALVWVVNAMVIASFGSLVMYMYSGLGEQFWNLITWVTAFLIGSLLVLVWNIKLPRGKIWFTLFLAYLCMQITALVGVVFMLNPALNALISTIVAFNVVILRYVFPKRKNWGDELPQRQSVHDAESWLTTMDSENQKRFHVISVNERPFIIGVSAIGHVYVIELTKIDQPFAIEEGEPRYHNKPIAGWLAESYLHARDLLPKGTPFLHIIAPTNAYRAKPQTVEITPRNSISGKPYTTLIIGQNKFLQSLDKVIKQEGANLETANIKQIDKLRNTFT